MSKMKKLKTCSNGHQFFKSSDCLSCPYCEAEKKKNEDHSQKLTQEVGAINNNIKQLDGQCKTVNDQMKQCDNSIAQNRNKFSQANA